MRKSARKNGKCNCEKIGHRVSSGTSCTDAVVRLAFLASTQLIVRLGYRNAHIIGLADSPQAE